MAKKKPVAKKAAAKAVSSSKSDAKEDYGPIVVKVIAILGYIFSCLGVLFGIALLFGGPFIASMMPMMNASNVSTALVGTILIVTAIIMIAVSIFGFFVAKALWDYKNWARIVVIIFSALGIIGGLTSLPRGIVGIIIHGVIIYFLAFDKNVTKLFK